MRSSRVPFVCATSCLVMVVASALALTLSACSPTKKDSHSYFPVNDAGYSYGSGDDEFVQERYMREFGYPETNEEWQDYMYATTPELIAVTTQDGAEGYIFSYVFMHVPESIEEAQEITKNYEEGFEVDVYDAQTMEIIGTMTLGGAGNAR